jgi:hypothetical protein
MTNDFAFFPFPVPVRNGRRVTGNLWYVIELPYFWELKVPPAGLEPPQENILQAGWATLLLM